MLLIMTLSVLSGCGNGKVSGIHAPRPYLAWEDRGEAEEAKCYLNDRFVGVGDKGFREQLRLIEQLEDGSTLHVFVPFNKFSESSDSNASIPLYRKSQLKEQFEDLCERKKLGLIMYLPEFVQEYKKEVPGIAFEESDT